MRVNAPINEQQVFLKWFPEGLGMFAFLRPHLPSEMIDEADKEIPDPIYITNYAEKIHNYNRVSLDPDEHIDTIRPERTSLSDKEYGTKDCNCDMCRYDKMPEPTFRCACEPHGKCTYCLEQVLTGGSLPERHIKLYGQEKKHKQFKKEA